MSLTLTAGNSTTNTPYTTANGDFNYVANVQKLGTSFQSANGTITKADMQVGNFNKYQNNPTSYNFSDSLTTAEKQSCVSDIDDIIDQLIV